VTESDDAQAEITDPDDIDALLESMDVDDADEFESAEGAQTEITDPEDIDALLESMNLDVPDNNSEGANSNEPEEVVQEESEEDAIQPIVSEADISENRAKIESLTEEYIAPLLSADFSDILAKTSEAELSEPTQLSENSIEEEEFDIDELIADVDFSNEGATEEFIEEEQSLIEEEPLDIGDDLISETFDEDTLTDLLTDEKSETAIELSPDFSDQNVLADLLNDNDEDSSSQVSEASEINDIQELDNLNFDELLANIEEESSVANQAANFNQIPVDNDELTLESFDNFNSSVSSTTSNDDENFVSVDSLLSASQDEISVEEPYEKANIDVGLNEFPEFTNDVNPIDVDIDENGITAKLDLAKVYLEIGDEDNAQVILKEVVKLGDPQQQSEAQDLLNDFE
jgi:pilus assembly protein FimV